MTMSRRHTRETYHKKDKKAKSGLRPEAPPRPSGGGNRIRQSRERALYLGAHPRWATTREAENPTVIAAEIHARLANTALLYFLALTIWGWWRFARREGVHTSYWGALAIGELILLAQAGLGAYLWMSGFRPARTMHLLYGIVSLLVIPAVYAYTQGREDRSEMLVHSAATLVLVGLVIRAMTTA